MSPRKARERLTVHVTINADRILEKFREQFDHDDVFEQWRKSFGKLVQFTPSTDTETERGISAGYHTGDQGRVVDVIWSETGWHLSVLMGGGGTFRAGAEHWVKVED